MKLGDRRERERKAGGQKDPQRTIKQMKELTNKQGQRVFIPPCENSRLVFRNTETGVFSQILPGLWCLHFRGKSPRRHQIRAAPPSLSPTIPLYTRRQIAPLKKKSAGRRWSGTINFTLVLPVSKSQPVPGVVARPSHCGAVDH